MYISTDSHGKMVKYDGEWENENWNCKGKCTLHILMAI